MYQGTIGRPVHDTFPGRYSLYAKTADHVSQYTQGMPAAGAIVPQEPNSKLNCTLISECRFLFQY